MVFGQLSLESVRPVVELLAVPVPGLHAQGVQQYAERRLAGRSQTRQRRGPCRYRYRYQLSTGG